MKMTRNEIRKEFNKIIEVGYCDLYYTLREYKKIGYNSGVYGWNYDVYMIDYNTCVLTGYRGYCGNIKPDYKTIDKYNKLEKKYVENGKRKDLKKLMTRFLKEIEKEG